MGNLINEQRESSGHVYPPVRCETEACFNLINSYKKTLESQLATRRSLICNRNQHFVILSEELFQRLHFKRCPAVSFALPTERSHITLFFFIFLFDSVSKNSLSKLQECNQIFLLSDHDELYWRSVPNSY